MSKRNAPKKPYSEFAVKEAAHIVRCFYSEPPNRKVDEPWLLNRITMAIDFQESRIAELQAALRLIAAHHDDQARAWGGEESDPANVAYHQERARIARAAVERLRKNTDKYPGFQNLNTEAADEIERLRAELANRPRFRAASEQDYQIANLWSVLARTENRLADAEKVVEAAREADAAYATYRDDKMRPHPDDAHEVRRWAAMNTLRDALAAYREKHKPGAV